MYVEGRELAIKDIIGNLYRRGGMMKDRLKTYKEFCKEQKEITRRFVEDEYQKNGVSELCLHYMKELDSWKDTLFNIRVFEDNEVVE